MYARVLVLTEALFAFLGDHLPVETLDRPYPGGHYGSSSDTLNELYLALHSNTSLRLSETSL